MTLATDYGAKHDCKYAVNCSIQAGSDTLGTDRPLSNEDVGKSIVIPGASLSGPGGDLITRIIGTDSSGNAILADEATNTESGVTCYYGTDDSSAYQWAINDLNRLDSPRALEVPPIGDALILNQLVIENTGNGGFSLHGVPTFRAEEMGGRFITAVDGGGGNYAPAIWSKKDGASFHGLSFQHAGTQENSANLTAILHKKTHNTDDAECVVHDCAFRFYHTNIDHHGRSLQAHRNAMVNHVVGIRLNWVSDGDFPARPNTTDLPTGFRGIHIEGNHQHNGGLLVEVMGTDPVFGLFMKNNKSDVYGRLFKGAAIESDICGNMASLGNHALTEAHIHITGGGRMLNIASNRLSGMQVTGDNDLTETAGFGILSDVFLLNSSVHGNMLDGFADAGIELSSGGTAVLCTDNNLRSCEVGIRYKGTISHSKLDNMFGNTWTYVDRSAMTDGGNNRGYDLTA